MLKVFCSLRWFLWCPFLPFQRPGAEQTFSSGVELVESSTKKIIDKNVCVFVSVIVLVKATSPLFAAKKMSHTVTGNVRNDHLNEQFILKYVKHLHTVLQPNLYRIVAV